MYIYISFLLMSFLNILISLIDKRFEKYMTFFLSINLIIFFGLRYNVGVDYNLYYETISNISGYEFERLEPAFKIIAIISHYLSPHLTFILGSTIYTLALFKFNIKYSPWPSLSFLLFLSFPFLLLSSLNLIRQFIAISIILFSIDYLINRKFIHYFLSIIIASLFHKSALILLFIYFFIMSTKLTIFVALSFMLAIKILLDFLVSINALPHIYIVGFEDKNIEISKVILLSSVILFYFIIFRLTHKIKRYRIEMVSYNMIILSLIFYITPKIYNISEELFIRFTFYFNQFLPLLIVYSIERIKILSDKLIVYLITIVLLFLSIFYYIYTLYFKGIEYNLIPYNWILG